MEKWIVNADETPLKIQANDLLRQVLVTTGSNRADVTMTGSGGCITATPFITASGRLLLVLYLIKGLNLKRCQPGTIEVNIPIHKPARASRGAPPQFHMVTATGFQNGRTWLKHIQQLHKYTEAERGSNHMLLLVDGFRAHRVLEAAVWALEHNIHMVFLPPNSTHLLQPLDMAPNAAFKNKLRTSVALMICGETTSYKQLSELLHQVTEQSVTEAMGKEVIMGSWDHTGLKMLETDQPVEIVKNSVQSQNSSKFGVAAELPVESKVAFEAFATILQGQQHHVQGVERRVVERNRFIPYVDLQHSPKPKARQRGSVKRKAVPKQLTLPVNSTTTSTGSGTDTQDSQAANKQVPMATKCCLCQKLALHIETWIGCNHCLLYWMCVECFEMGGDHMLADHEPECAPKKKARKK